MINEISSSLISSRLFMYQVYLTYDARDRQKPNSLYPKICSSTWHSSPGIVACWKDEEMKWKFYRRYITSVSSVSVENSRFSYLWGALVHCGHWYTDRGFESVTSDRRFKRTNPRLGNRLWWDKRGACERCVRPPMWGAGPVSQWVR